MVFVFRVSRENSTCPGSSLLKSPILVGNRTFRYLTLRKNLLKLAASHRRIYIRATTRVVGICNNWRLFESVMKNVI